MADKSLTVYLRANTTGLTTGLKGAQASLARFTRLALGMSATMYGIFGTKKVISSFMSFEEAMRKVNTVADEVNPTSVRSLAANNVPSKQVEEEQEKKNVEIADMTKDSSVSELASFGVRLTELQVLPIGYNIYLAAVLKDAPFYAPKAIYRNQTVVDNAPAQRLLQFASDAKFDQMVSQQYGEK